MIDFSNDYRGSWMSVSILSALACSNGDTWASELGTVFGRNRPVLITSWKRVPRGVFHCQRFYFFLKKNTVAHLFFTLDFIFSFGDYS